MLLQLVLWIRACRSEHPRGRGVLACCAGAAAGAATLVRPSWLLFTPFALSIAMCFSGERKRHLATGLVVLVALVLVMAPWWARNWRVTGRFVPTTLQVGASLYDGWNRHATGGSDMRPVARFRAIQRRQEAAMASPPAGTFEWRLDRRLRVAAIDWARENPRQVVRLMGVKLVRLWNIWPNEPALRAWPLRLVVMAGYIPVLICGIWGLGRFARRGWPYVLCALPAVYFTMLHVVFVSSIRYRQPAMLTLIVLAAGAIAYRTSREKVR
jgi:hypothetical protein